MNSERRGKHNVDSERRGKHNVDSEGRWKHNVDSEGVESIMWTVREWEA